MNGFPRSDIDSAATSIERDGMMNTMDCTDIKAMLSAYLDDELEKDQRHTAERHLADCAACRALVDEAERLDALLAMDETGAAGGEIVGAVSLPNDFESGVLLRTVYADAAAGRPGRSWWLWSGWMVAAASLTLAVVLWMVGTSFRLMPDSPMLALNLDEPPRAADDNTPSGRAVNASMTYTAGRELRSRTYDGALPAEFFLTSMVSSEPDLDGAPARPGAVRSSILGNPRRMPDPMLVGDSVPNTADDAALDQEKFKALMNQPTISREDAQTLYSVAVLLDLLRSANLSSFEDVERIRQVIEYDELPARLRSLRERVSAADRPLILAAESILLRIARGPLDRTDVHVLRDTVAQLDLSRELDAMSAAPRRPGSL